MNDMSDINEDFAILDKFLVVARTQGIPLASYSDYLDMCDEATTQFAALRAAVAAQSEALAAAGEAIAEWERAKKEREAWRPVIGQMPPASILNNANKANAMLTAALAKIDALAKLGKE